MGEIKSLRTQGTPYIGYGMVERLVRELAAQDSIKASFNCILEWNENL